MMLDRIINWRARVNGVRWFTAAERGAPDLEQGGKALTSDEEAFLLSVEQGMARTYRGIPVVPGVSAERWAEVGITPPAPRRRLPWHAYVRLGIVVAAGAVFTVSGGYLLARGDWQNGMVHLAVGAVCYGGTWLTVSLVRKHSS